MIQVGIGEGVSPSAATDMIARYFFLMIEKKRRNEMKIVRKNGNVKITLRSFIWK